MELYLHELYRTRLYAPLILFFIFYIRSDRLRALLSRLNDRISGGGRIRAGLFPALIAFIVALALIYPGKSWGGDFSQYLAQARAIVTGTIDQWYEKNSFIIDNSYDGLGADVYPWMLSIIVAPIYALLGYFPYTLLKVMLALCFAGAVFFLFEIFCERMSRKAAFIASLFIAVNLTYAFNVNACDADMLCFFFSAAALYFTDRHLNGGGDRRILYAALSGLCIFCAIQTKTLSMGLLIALACCDLMKVLRSVRAKVGKIRNIAEKLIPYIVYFGCTGLINAVLPRAGGTYRGYFELSSDRIAQGIKYYFDTFAGFFGGDTRPIIHVISVTLCVLMLIFACVGAFNSFSKDLYFILYIGGTLAMLFIYKYYRVGFIFAVFPALIMEAAAGLEFTVSKATSANKRIKVYISAAVASVLLLTFAASAAISWAIHLKGFNYNEATTDDALDIYDFVNENIPETAVVWFFKPRVLYYYTGVYSYIRDNSAENLEIADYAIVNTDTSDQVSIYLASNESYLRIYGNDTWTIYERSAGK